MPTLYAALQFTLFWAVELLTLLAPCPLNSKTDLAVQGFLGFTRISTMQKFYNQKNQPSEENFHYNIKVSNKSQWLLRFKVLRLQEKLIISEEHYIEDKRMVVSMFLPVFKTYLG